MRSQATALGVCASIGLLFCTTTLAEKTTVAVEKGQVRAKTSGGEVTVAAGQKAVLTPGEKPLTGVDDPMVDDLIALSKWIDTERQSKRIRIESASIQIVAIESENRCKTVALFEEVNQSKEPATTGRIGNMPGAVEPRFYDMQGRLLKYDMKKSGEGRATYNIRLQEPVPPGADIKFICVDVRPPKGYLSTDGKTWRVWISHGSPNCLNYFRLILPKSAILIDASSRPVLVDETNGRVAVTLRNYTGEDTGAEHFLFLWPEHDGTSLDDVPAEYRGGQDAWKASMQEQYREQMAKIRAGHDYDDQSTPLAALLSVNAALIRNDRERLMERTMGGPGLDRKKADAEFQRLEAALGGMQGVRELMVDTIDMVSAPPWPKNPLEGATYEIDKYGRGSRVRNWTTGFVFHDGKWWWAWNQPGPGLPTDDVWIKEHAKPRPTSGANADRRAELTREYQAQMERIRKGADYNDQSTPLATLLTRNAAIIRDDMERVLATVDPKSDPERKEARKEIEGMKKELGVQGFREQIVDVVDSVNSPVWPEKPREETIHKIDMFGRTSSGESPLPAFYMFLIYREGKWYVQSNSPGPGHPMKKEQSKQPPTTAPGK